MKRVARLSGRDHARVGSASGLDRAPARRVPSRRPGVVGCRARRRNTVNSVLSWRVQPCCKSAASARATALQRRMQRHCNAIATPAARLRATTLQWRCKLACNRFATPGARVKITASTSAMPRFLSTAQPFGPTELTRANTARCAPARRPMRARCAPDARPIGRPIIARCTSDLSSSARRPSIALFRRYR